jgi:hypothetical protein
MPQPPFDRKRGDEMGGKKAEETIAIGSFPFGPPVSQPEAPAPLHPFVKGLSFCLKWG